MKKSCHPPERYSIPHQPAQKPSHPRSFRLRRSSDKYPTDQLSAADEISDHQPVEFQIKYIQKQLNEALLVSASVLEATPIVDKAGRYFQPSESIPEHDLNSAIAHTKARVDELLQQVIDESYQLAVDPMDDQGPIRTTPSEHQYLRSGNHSELASTAAKKTRNNGQRDVLIRGLDVYEQALTQMKTQQQMHLRFENLLRDMQGRLQQEERASASESTPAVLSSTGIPLGFV
jgi:hypothetical protein